MQSVIKLCIYFAIASLLIGSGFSNYTHAQENLSEIDGASIPEAIELHESFSGISNTQVYVERYPEAPGVLSLHFSWKLPASVTQSAFQVLLSSSMQYTDDQIGDVWDSGKLLSNRTVATVKDSEVFTKELGDGFYYWRVRVWDENGNQSIYSEPQRFYLLASYLFGAINGIPTAPESGFGTASSPTSIRWEFTDTSEDETGFAVFAHDLIVATTAPDPVRDYHYLEEKNLTPNTRYGGRTVRSFNPYGFSSASAEYFPVYTLAATPGIPWLYSISEKELKIAIDPHGNPDDTQYAVYNQAQRQYILADGTTSDDPDWQTLASWQSITLKKSDGPFGLTVKARNGDRIETGFSPLALFEDSSGAVPGIELQINAAIQHAQAPKPAPALTTSIAPIARNASAISLSLLWLSAFLFVAGLFTLIQYVEGNSFEVFAKIPALVTLPVQTVYQRYIDKRFVSERWHAVLTHGTRITLVILLVNSIVHVSALLFGSYTLAQNNSDFSTEERIMETKLAFGDQITYQVSVKNVSDTTMHDVRIQASIPPQVKLVSAESYDSGFSITKTKHDLGGLLNILDSKEVFRLRYTVAVADNPVFAGTVVASSATAATGSDAEVTTAPPITIAGEPSSLINALVKLPDDPRIYQIDEKTYRRPFTSQAVYESWFGNDFSAVSEQAQQILEQFPEGESMLFKQGSLVRFADSEHIYRVMDNEGVVALIDRDDAEMLVPETPMYTISEAEFAKYKIVY